MSQISFNLFCSGYKGLLSEFLRKWGWFLGDNEHFSKYLGWMLKSQKTETGFCKLKSTDNNDINTFLSLVNLCTFFIVKEKTWKRIFNINSELLQNRTEKQIIPSKITISWLFNDMWCYMIEKLAFFNKQLSGFIISLKTWTPETQINILIYHLTLWF